MIANQLFIQWEYVTLVACGKERPFASNHNRFKCFASVYKCVYNADYKEMVLIFIEQTSPYYFITL